MDGAGGSQPKNTSDAEWPQLEEVQRPFDEVSAQLALLGALSVDDFLSNAPTVLAAYDLSLTLQHPPEQLEQEATAVEIVHGKANDVENVKGTDKDKDEDGDKEGEPTAEDGVVDSKVAARKDGKNCVYQLRQASLNVFGSTECLDWGYVEGPMPTGKQCILTIKRPSGATRSYKSDIGHSRKQDARGQAAQIAIDMGAIDFIVSGDLDALKAKKGLLLNPLDVQLESVDSLEADPAPTRWTLGEEPLKVIEECCQEWRAGNVKPHWVPYTDFKNNKKIGVAMRISLNTHVYRAYSVDPVHNSLRQAKVACSRAAIDQGVLDFIRYGNGQTQPMKVPENEIEIEDMHNTERDSPPPMTVKGISLQEFYDSLPQPFPEDLGEKSAAEFNGSAWLNIAVQSARGARLTIKFIPVVDGINRFHGSVLRLERPEEIRTYVVDPQFPKRADAKNAVCLLAMSQGVGRYLRELKEGAENKLPEEKRKLANGVLLQVLSVECSKIRPGNRLAFNYPQDRDAFGCTLTADISSDPLAPNIQEFSVPTEYPNKADAKAAVACLAAEKGLVDVFRFKGGPLPPDYVPFWEAQVNGEGDKYVPKRKEPERDVDGEGRDRKKRKKGNNGPDAGEPSPPPKPTMVLHASLPAKPVTAPPPDIFSSNNRWKGPRTSASRGLGSTNGRASASRMVNQDRSGNRSGDIPYHPENHYSSSSAAPLASRNPYPRVHPHPREYDDREDYRHEAGYRDTHTRYGRTDHYGNPYPVYSPPSGSGHYSVSGYRSPPPAMPPVALPPSVPPPPNHYQGYYTGPSTPTSGSPHSPYAQYAYPPPPSYHPQYPHMTSYGSYPHPPGLYPSPPPPPHLPPSPAMRGRPPRQASTSRDSHMYPDVGYDRDMHFAPSPARPSTPPRRSHVSYPSHPVEFGHVDVPRPVRRRHSTVADVRTRDSYPIQSAGNHDSQYDGKKPPPPVVENTLPDNNRAERDQQSREMPASRPEPLVAPAIHSTTSVHAEKPPSPAPRPTVIPTKGPTRPSKVVPTKSNDPATCLRALYDFCDQEKIDRPKFFNQQIAGSEPKKYTVWAEKDSHRLELPNQFSSVEEGYEKLSKSVLSWERSRLQKPQ